MWLGSINVVPGLDNATTPQQKKQSAYMESALVAFASNTKDGLTRFGWPVYGGTQGETLFHFAPRNSTKLAVLENPSAFDAPCNTA